jgi:hypothetical protein
VAERLGGGLQSRFTGVRIPSRAISLYTGASRIITYV